MGTGVAPGRKRRRFSGWYRGFEVQHGAGREKDKPGNVAELLAWYDKQVTRAINRVRGLNAQQLLTPVNFFGVFNLPVAFYLGFMNNHSVHHRGALATYLRPMGSKVPSIYGGSHDEPFQPQSSAA